MNKSAATAHQKTVLACAFVLLAGYQVSGQTQSADSANINFSGQISSTTCTLNMNDATGSVNGGTKTVNLGTVSSSSAGTGAAGDGFSALKDVVFSLKDADGVTACTLGAGNTAWDIVLSLSNSQIVTIGSNTYLRNSLTTNATDALVGVLGGIGTQGTTPLTLEGNLGLGGTRISGTSTGATTDKSLALSVKFVRASTSAPSPGTYSATIPLLVIYK